MERDACLHSAVTNVSGLVVRTVKGSNRIQVAFQRCLLLSASSPALLPSPIHSTSCSVIFLGLTLVGPVSVLASQNLVVFSSFSS